MVYVRGSHPGLAPGPAINRQGNSNGVWSWPGKHMSIALDRYVELLEQSRFYTDATDSSPRDQVDILYHFE